MEDFTSLWEDYKLQGNLEAKDALIKLYLPLVRQLAAGIKRKLSQSVEFEDLISDGAFGLIRAVELFDLSRGVKFETYATQVIRGSIYNGLRALDWVPERTRGKARALQKAMNQFALIHGRAGTEDELAEELKITAQEVYDLITDLGCIYLLSLEQPLPEMQDEDLTIMEVVEDKRSPDPLSEVEFAEMQCLLQAAVDDLNDREQILIKEHYFAGKSFEQIAKILGVTKQRISQMHNRALRKLKEALAKLQITSEAMHNIA